MDVQALSQHELSDVVPGSFPYISRPKVLLAYDWLGPTQDRSLLVLGVLLWSSHLIGMAGHGFRCGSFSRGYSRA